MEFIKYHFELLINSTFGLSLFVVGMYYGCRKTDREIADIEAAANKNKPKPKKQIDNGISADYRISRARGKAVAAATNQSWHQI